MTLKKAECEGAALNPSCVAASVASGILRQSRFFVLRLKKLRIKGALQNKIISKDNKSLRGFK